MILSSYAKCMLFTKSPVGSEIHLWMIILPEASPALSHHCSSMRPNASGTETLLKHSVSQEHMWDFRALVTWRGRQKKRFQERSGSDWRAPRSWGPRSSWKQGLTQTWESILGFGGGWLVFFLIAQGRETQRPGSGKQLTKYHLKVTA